MTPLAPFPVGTLVPTPPPPPPPPFRAPNRSSKCFPCGCTCAHTSSPATIQGPKPFFQVVSLWPHLCPHLLPCHHSGPQTILPSGFPVAALVPTPPPTATIQGPKPFFQVLSLWPHLCPHLLPRHHSGPQTILPSGFPVAALVPTPHPPPPTATIQGPKPFFQVLSLWPHLCPHLLPAIIHGPKPFFQVVSLWLHLCPHLPPPPPFRAPSRSSKCFPCGRTCAHTSSPATIQGPKPFFQVVSLWPHLCPHLLPQHHSGPQTVLPSAFPVAALVPTPPPPPPPHRHHSGPQAVLPSAFPVAALVPTPPPPPPTTIQGPKPFFQVLSLWPHLCPHLLSRHHSVPQTVLPSEATLRLWELLGRSLR
ncbi:uncharacterized protein [Narcine bancroftii]|uniref:uncharacterized protein n=1 Tax=Narcine bancroftii TaxID=1343680 RepID=UPI00383183EB